MSKPSLIFAILIAIIFSTNSQAEVYKWTDADGKVHYSSQKKSAEATVAELPELTRGEVPKDPSASQTCFSHGGIDCAAGADEDGSVICKDGEKNVSERYLFNCKEAKITLERIGEVNEEGDFVIYIRNKTGVVAKNVAVSYKVTNDHTEQVSGPAEIIAYEIGEYKLPGLLFLDGVSKPEKNKFKISCENCP